MTFKAHTLHVYPVGYMGALGFFEADRSIRVINSAESRRVIRGRVIDKFNLVGFKFADLDADLLATIQICGVASETETGILQQYFEVELTAVEREKYVPVKRKRDILHLTFNAELGLTLEDIQAVQKMFMHAKEDPHGAVLTTIDGINAELISINEGAEIRLVSAHVQDDIVYHILEQGEELVELTLAGESDEEREEVEMLDGEDEVERSVSQPTPGIVFKGGKFYQVEDTGRVDSPMHEIDAPIGGASMREDVE